jgi:type IV pilus assembly protein PilA
MMKKLAPGFTLIELLIVIAIILVIAAIAIPNLLRSRIAANQASAVASLRTLTTAEVTYATTYNIGYSAELSYLGPASPAGTAPNSTAAGIVDSVLAGATNTSEKSGYLFTYSPGAVFAGKIVSFSIHADPVARGVTGSNSYFVDDSGVIRQNMSGTQATSADSPLGG